MIVVDSPASAAGAVSEPVSSNPTSSAAHVVGVDDAVFLATYFVAPIVHDVFFTAWANVPELSAN